MPRKSKRRPSPPPEPAPHLPCKYEQRPSTGWRWYAGTFAWERVCERHNTPGVARRGDYIPDDDAVARYVPEPLPIIAVLIERRREQGRSQLDVACEIDVSQVQVCRWETGRSAPTLRHLIAWADDLGCEITATPKEDL